MRRRTKPSVGSCRPRLPGCMRLRPRAAAGVVPTPGPTPGAHAPSRRPTRHPEAESEHAAAATIGPWPAARPLPTSPRPPAAVAPAPCAARRRSRHTPRATATPRTARKRSLIPINSTSAEAARHTEGERPQGIDDRTPRGPMATTLAGLAIRQRLGDSARRTRRNGRQLAGRLAPSQLGEDLHGLWRNMLATRALQSSE